ncbi:MAG: bifunctional 3-(3-hydroxy-phenyl)propionate/3-hydroxycinnamic acid hydroxylase [Gammaproteobacteria bacterium]|nr:bifunctional 3-(3-hydroxy-phenyl)propionate/3-hydroxycinnamic acid hydroxylase [Gammaproteobacteria bacterium]
MAKNSSRFSLENTDVLIVGYGPVGAAVAALLGRYGVRTTVIDKGQDILMMPRAIALDNEALRILQMAGLDDQSFERIGIQQVRMHSPYMGQFGRVNTSGTIDGHPKLVTFYQPDLEKALRNKVAQHSCVNILYRCELVDLQQFPDRIEAITRNVDGKEQRISARFVVGADGANSRVREIIGQSFEGQTYAEDWLIVDANQREKKAIDHVEFLCDPKRPTPHMLAPGGRERWEFMLLPGETREQMEKPEKLAELLSPWIKPDELTIERQAVYRFHARCCDRFQKGRIFLVGDAAHITPPFVGQGLVAGLRDAANLCWKLSSVVSGRSHDRILDSYDQERRPHAREMIDLAKLMGKLVMPSTTTKAVAVHGLMRLLRMVPPVRTFFEELKVKPANRFKNGLFVPGRSAVGLQRGGQFPQDLVRSPSGICLSDDVLGDQLTLVGIGVDPAAVLDVAALAQWEAAGAQVLHLGMRGQTGNGTTRFAEIMGNNLVLKAPQGWLAVVRPDRVVMHDGPPQSADTLVGDSLRVLSK